MEKVVLPSTLRFCPIKTLLCTEASPCIEIEFDNERLLDIVTVSLNTALLKFVVLQNVALLMKIDSPRIFTLLLIVNGPLIKTFEFKNTLLWNVVVLLKTALLLKTVLLKVDKPLAVRRLEIVRLLAIKVLDTFKLLQNVVLLLTSRLYVSANVVTIPFEKVALPNAIILLLNVATPKAFIALQAVMTPSTINGPCIRVCP